MKMNVSEENLRSLRVREITHVEHMLESKKRVRYQNSGTHLETREPHGQIELQVLISTENSALQQRLMDPDNYTPKDSHSHSIFKKCPRYHPAPATKILKKCDHSPSNFLLQQDPVPYSEQSFFGRTQTTRFRMVLFPFVCFLFLTTVGARDIRYPPTSSIKSWRLQKSEKSLPSVIEPLTETPKAKELERVARSAQTPPSKPEKTTTKRDISPFITNSHHKPQRLATKLGYYVEIKKNGKVKGSRRQTAYSVFELISIETGIVAIRAQKTGRYLAMDKKGRLVGLKSYTSASNFHESLIENNYFVFYQDVIVKVGRNRRYIRQVYMGFDKRGKPKRGKKVHRNDSSAHFQKLLADYPEKKQKSKGRKSRVRKSKKA